MELSTECGWNPSRWLHVFHFCLYRAAGARGLLAPSLLVPSHGGLVLESLEPNPKSLRPPVPQHRHSSGSIPTRGLTGKGAFSMGGLVQPPACGHSEAVATSGCSD